MDFELALQLPDNVHASILPLRLAYRQKMFMVLDSEGRLDHFPEDWEAANDLAGVTGRIIHWFRRNGHARTGAYGFEALLLGPDRVNTGKCVWLTFGELNEPVIAVAFGVDPEEFELATPLSGAEFVRGRCEVELRAIQSLLVDAHPALIEDDIKAQAPWLSAGGSMSVGSEFSLFGEEIAEEAVVFDYPDQSQMAVKACSIHLAPVTFSPETTRRMLWGQFGHA